MVGKLVAAGDLLLLSGLGMAFVSALVPHYYTGYNLNIGVLAAGIAPWLVYGIVLQLMRTALPAVAGLALALLHAWLVLTQRFGETNPYSDNLIYSAPLIAALLLIPFAVLVIHRVSRQMMTPVTTAAEGSDE